MNIKIYYTVKLHLLVCESLWNNIHGNEKIAEIICISDTNG